MKDLSNEKAEHVNNHIKITVNMAHVTQITRIAGKEYHTYSDGRTEERGSSTCSCNNKKLSVNKPNPPEQQEKLFPATLADGEKNSELDTNRKGDKDDPRDSEGREMPAPMGIELEH